MLGSSHWNSSGFPSHTSRMAAPTSDLSLHLLPAVYRQLNSVSDSAGKSRRKSVPLLHAADLAQRMGQRAHLRLPRWMEKAGRPPLPWLQAACHQIPHGPVPLGCLRAIQIQILTFLGVSKGIDGCAGWCHAREEKRGRGVKCTMGSRKLDTKCIIV
jgi:hypothetical protein